MPILDAREADFNKNTPSIALEREYLPKLNQDLPEGSIVSVGYTIGTRNPNATRDKAIEATIGFYIHNIILLATP